MGKRNLLVAFFLILIFVATSTPVEGIEGPLMPETKYKVYNIAHRGVPYYAPEHTMPSLEMAVEMGADFLEIDIQMTKDGTIVAMHDTTLNRTTSGMGLVRYATLRELKELDAGSWFNEKYPEMANEKFIGLEVPTLEEIFQRFGRNINYLIEIKSPQKNPGIEEELLRLIEKHHLGARNGMSNKLVVQSFHPETLQKIYKENPNLPLFHLLKKRASEAELRKIATYAVGTGISGKKLSKSFVKVVKEHGLYIHTYSIDSPKQMKEAIKLGVDGIVTNYPDRLQEVLMELK
ncbi:glycerophosphoryl diester phosphodiesterase [Evansella vedderi]|uniref:Glycerophosphoryl diester phosphodiesterase n=1 Tax=Evansella vedderi TaxID=38282 RepID=A0ABU0A0J5_9BACI|nr:glycerophosphodiester phosphodiesterase [Evansella vedderi]MDQ0256995.1 glycerophosphoryl diester phosphodiesterase [Evansella vedderi]